MFPSLYYNLKESIAQYTQIRYNGICLLKFINPSFLQKGSIDLVNPDSIIHASFLENEDTLRLLDRERQGRFYHLASMHALSAALPFIFRSGVLYIACPSDEYAFLRHAKIELFQICHAPAFVLCVGSAHPVDSLEQVNEINQLFLNKSPNDSFQFSPTFLQFTCEQIIGYQS